MTQCLMFQCYDPSQCITISSLERAERAGGADKAASGEAWPTIDTMPTPQRISHAERHHNYHSPNICNNEKITPSQQSLPHPHGGQQSPNWKLSP